MPLRSGIVLAGGRGTRLGLGMPKARIELAGTTLVERAIECLSRVCRDVVVVAPPRLDIGPTRTPRVADVEGGEGPLAGVLAGLEARAGDACAVLGVDFPCAESGLFEALFERLNSARALPACDAVVPRPGDVAQPLVAVYAPTAAAALRASYDSLERSIRRALEGLAVLWVDDAEIDRLPGGRLAFLNVNTPADLERARARFAAGAGPLS